MTLLRIRTRHYATPWGIRRVKVWKLGPFVVWRRPISAPLSNQPDKGEFDG